MRAYQLLGGRKTLHRDVRNSLDAHDLIFQGLPSASLMQLINRVQVLSSGDALEKAIGMSLRTIQRRKKEGAQKHLSTEKSSRVWRFAEILTHAIDVMGSEEAAEDWIASPAIGLDNRRPLDLLAAAARVW